MENKKFTVVDTRSNQVKRFESQATTVAELKEDMRRNGIDPTEMAIQEGLTKTELTSDSQLLPTNVEYKGVVTNNLVFRLTQPNRKIESGLSRQALYDTVKELNLASTLKAKYGRPYTSISTSDLEKEIQLAAPVAEEEVIVPKNNLETAFVMLVDELVYNGSLDKKAAVNIKQILNVTADAGYTAKEIEEMFN